MSRVPAANAGADDQRYPAPSQLVASPLEARARFLASKQPARGPPPELVAEEVGHVVADGRSQEGRRHHEHDRQVGLRGQDGGGDGRRVSGHHREEGIHGHHRNDDQVGPRRGAQRIEDRVEHRTRLVLRERPLAQLLLPMADKAVEPFTRPTAVAARIPARWRRPHPKGEIAWRLSSSTSTAPWSTASETVTASPSTGPSRRPASPTAGTSSAT